MPRRSRMVEARGGGWRTPLVLALAASALVACAGPQRPRDGVAGESVRRTASGTVEGSVSSESLREMNRAFADRFSTYLINADVAIGRTAPSPRQRMMMHRLKTYASSAVYDIVTDGDPLSQLLDLLLYTTIQSYIWIDEGEAVEIFGPERAVPLIEQLHAARLDVWRTAAKVLTTQQLETIDNIILQWRRANPDLDYLAFVRFDEIAQAQGEALVKELRRDGGLFGSLSQAVEKLDEFKELADQALFLSKRMPMLANWQVQDLINSVAARPETIDTLAAIDSLVRDSERITTTLAELPETIARERRETIEAVFASAGDLIETSHGDLRETIASATALLETGQGVVDGGERLLGSLRETLEAVERTLAAADRFMGRFDPPEGAAPRAPSETPPPTLDDYLRSMAEATRLLQEVNLVMASSQGLLESEVWQRRLEQINDAAESRVDHAAEQTRLTIHYATLQSLLVVGAVFVGLVLLRLAGSLLPRRG